GTISAKGGTSRYAGAGSGGRIAIYYNSVAFSQSNIIVDGGLSGDGSIPSRNGSKGTLVLQSK
ncbi:MAG: hypothetical protein AABZ62_05410, partial [Planctomycetota bacterium]